MAEQDADIEQIVNTEKREIPDKAEYGIFYKNKVRLENERMRLQAACIKWFRDAYPQYAKLMVCIPRGFPVRPETMEKYLRMGFWLGMPDLILLVPSGLKPFLAIWVKAGTRKIIKGQIVMRNAYEAAGAQCLVTTSFNEFVETVHRYLS